MKKRNGFTLIELLIVIAIIAVLSVVVILALNPAELLRQARDSNRISDMATLKSAVTLYLADVASPSMGSAGTCYISLATATAMYVPNTGGTYASAANCANWMLAATSTVIATTTRGIGTGTTSNGWLPVAFSAISSGSPLGQEPIDPVNQNSNTPANCTGASSSIASLSSCALLYSYDISGTSFKLATMMESKKYTNGGAGDVETPDGGNNNYVYEGGTLPTL